MPRDLRSLLHGTGSAPTRPVEAPAMVRRALRRAARRAAAVTVVALIGAATLIQGCSEGGVGFEPASPEAGEPDVPAPSTRQPEASESPETESPETKEPTMPAPADPAPEVVTEAHDGATFTLALGGSTALRLSNDWLWDAPEVSGAAVELVPVDYFADPGYVEWQVDAVAAGTSEVTVAGAPNCGEEDACPPRSVTLRFGVEG